MTGPREPEFSQEEGQPVLPTPPGGSLPPAPSQPVGVESPSWSFGRPASDQAVATPDPAAEPQPWLPQPPAVVASPQAASVPESAEPGPWLPSAPQPWQP